VIGPALLAGAYDIDGNGKADLVGVGGVPTIVRLYQNPLDGGLVLGFIGTGGGAFELVGVADLDGDGDDDLIFQGATHYRVNLLEGDFAVAQGYVPRLGTTFAAAGDVDGDGKADLFLDGPTFFKIDLMDGVTQVGSVFIGNGNCEFPVALVADLDGDGRVEAVSNGVSSGMIRINRVLVSQGCGSCISFLTNGAGAFKVVAAGDVDGDGKADLFLDGPSSTRIEQMDGLFAIGRGHVSNGGGAYPVTVVGDFDGDGKTDLASDPRPGTVAYLRIDLLDGTLSTGRVFRPHSGFETIP